MWTMHDYPGFGAISGFQTKGYCACSTCAYMLPYGWSYELRKVVYLQYFTFLPLDHPFRGVGADKNLDEPPIPRTMEWWRARWDPVQTGNIQLDESGLRRWSILHELPYWKSLQIHHLLDPMHIEANVVKSLIKHLFGDKDNVRARRGCEEFNMHPESWMQVSDDGTETMPPAPWVLRKEERKTLCQRISKIRFPTGFGSYLRKAFTTDKASWPSDLKSHDFHILLQHVLPTCLHGLGTQELREVIYDLSRLMRWVCSKEINVSEVPRMDIFAAETLCKLEKILPPLFFDSHIHLLVHLVRKISICGPVHTRWMHWLECYMKVLKDDVRQRAKPEGSMAEGHLHREAMFFCSTILAQLDPGSLLLFREVEDGEEASFRLIGAGSTRSLSAMELDQIHVFILYNSELLENWILRYEEDKRMASDEPFCYPSFVEQCFYVECSHDVDWSFVIPYIPRERQFVGSDSLAAT
ncbi:hypothetical protein R1sor_022328 [Riccia sorocarpa]|uniref:DUF4218 domain-containing protein n=1 Tax=Riccia sorocarpa TaxID=122646 RepID=A0ABD3GMI2_9MARC